MHVRLQSIKHRLQSMKHHNQCKVLSLQLQQQPCRYIHSSGDRSQSCLAVHLYAALSNNPIAVSCSGGKRLRLIVEKWWRCSVMRTRYGPLKRQWLRCDIDSQAEDVCIVLARRSMLITAVRRGMGEPLFMDATHGLQKYGLKLVTVHVLDEENSGKSFLDAAILSIPLVISSRTKFGWIVSRCFACICFYRALDD
jgi:hypothetical protein